MSYTGGSAESALIGRLWSVELLKEYQATKRDSNGEPEEMLPEKYVRIRAPRRPMQIDGRQKFSCSCAPPDTSSCCRADSAVKSLETRTETDRVRVACSDSWFRILGGDIGSRLSRTRVSSPMADTRMSRRSLGLETEYVGGCPTVGAPTVPVEPAPIDLRGVPRARRSSRSRLIASASVVRAPYFSIRAASRRSRSDALNRTLK